MSIDGSFNITFKNQELVFEKNKVELGKIDNNANLQLLHNKLYLDNINSYILSNDDNYKFFIDNKEILQTTRNGGTSIGTTSNNGTLHIHDPINAGIGFSTEGTGTTGFSISLDTSSNRLSFNNNDHANYAFHPYHEVKNNKGLYFTPITNYENATVSQIGIRAQNPGNSAMYVGGARHCSLRIGNFNFKRFIYGMTNTNWGQYMQGGNTWIGLTNYLDVHLHSIGHIAAGRFAVFSDKRIKSNIRSLNTSSSLEKIRLLKPCYFNKIDFIEKGRGRKIGFIAQEVEKIIPETSNIRSEYIPNIYRPGLCLLKEHNNYILTIEDYDTKHLLLDSTNNYLNLSVQDINHNRIRDIVIINVLSSNTLEIQSSVKLAGSVYVYGQEVNDFHLLEYDHIFTHSTAALKECDKLLQLQKSKNEKLEMQLKILQNRANILLDKQ